MKALQGMVPLGACLLLACGGDDFRDVALEGPDAGVGGTGGTGGTAGEAGSAGDAGDDDVSTGGSGSTGGEAGAGGQDAGDAEAGGSGGDDAGDAEAEPYCDPTSLPDEDSCVIHDDHGIFVSPSGNDAAGCGTMALPCATVTLGLAEAKAAGKRLYVCGDGGSYAENLTIDAVLDGLTVFGGFRCSDWAYDAANVKSLVAPPSGSAINVEGLSTGLEISDFSFVSSNATDPGASSIAAVVINAHDVVFRRCELEAGDGADGVAGQPGTPGTDWAVADSPQNGVSASCSTVPSVQQGGEWSDPSGCGSQGGYGGPALKNNSGSEGDQGIPLVNVTPPSVDNRGAGGTVGRGR